MTGNSQQQSIAEGNFNKFWEALRWREVRYAVRTLLRARTFTVTSILAIGLAIGAATTVFEVVYCVLLKPLPYPDSGRIVSVWMKPPGGSQQPVDTGGQPTSSERRMTGWQGLLERGRYVPELSGADFFDIRGQMRAFSAVAAAEPFSYTLTNVQDPVTLHAFRVTGDFFSIGYAKPLVGRTLVPSDYGASGDTHVAILSSAAWHRYFQGSSDVVGKLIHLNGEPYQIVGVMPSTYHLPIGGYYSNIDVWTPMPETAESYKDRQSAYWPVIARLASGISLDQAQVQLSAFATNLAKLYPDTNRTRSFSALPLRQVLVGTLRAPLLLLFAATLTLFMIACINTAGLVIARTLDRQHEFDIRRALGANAWILTVQLLTELLLVALASAIVGVISARIVIPLLVSLNPMETPLFTNLHLDFVGVVFAFGLALLSLPITGLKPLHVLLGSFRKQRLHLTSHAFGETKATRATREMFLVGQIALCVILLAGAGLLLRSLTNLLSIDPGFRTSRVIAAETTLYGATRTEGQVQQLVSSIISRLKALPGITDVAAVSNLPLQDTPVDYRSPIGIIGEPNARAADKVPILHTIVTNNYFQTMGIRLIRGRTFDGTDTPKSPRTAVISHALQRLYWGDANPIGAYVRLGFPVNGNALVVGVVGDVMHARPGAPVEPEVYVSQFQVPSRLLTFVSRTNSDDLHLVASVRSVLRNEMPTSPIGVIDTMEHLRAGVFRPEVFNTFILNVVASLALGFALIGIFSSLHYTVVVQRRDIAVRMALGAQRSTIARGFLRRSSVLTMVGLMGGGAVALLLTRFMSAMLFRVVPWDFSTYAAIALIIFCTSLLASVIPAYLATRTDPMSSLKIE